MILKTENNTKAVIKIKGLKKSFGDNHVLNDFNVELREGENLVVLGKSGSGKSVLIKCIIGLMNIDSGAIQVFDDDVSNLSHDDLDNRLIQFGFLV